MIAAIIMVIDHATGRAQVYVPAGFEIPFVLVEPFAGTEMPATCHAGIAWVQPDTECPAVIQDVVTRLLTSPVQPPLHPDGLSYFSYAQPDYEAETPP